MQISTESQTTQLEIQALQTDFLSISKNPFLQLHLLPSRTLLSRDEQLEHTFTSVQVRH